MLLVESAAARTSSAVCTNATFAICVSEMVDTFQNMFFFFIFFLIPTNIMLSAKMSGAFEIIELINKQTNKQKKKLIRSQ